MLHLDALSQATTLTSKRLAAQFGDEAARWALMQVDLRKRAVRKFGEVAAEMVFEREALEQATQQRVARYHASKYPSGCQIVDLTAGIGGDAYWFAHTHSVLAFETSAERAEYAKHNCASTPQPVEVRTEDSLVWLESNNPDYVWSDPDRRAPSGKRLLSPEDYVPNPTLLAERLRQTRRSGMKLSPMLSDEYLASLGGKVEFISYGGECCEALVWLGSEVESGWGAVVLDDAGATEFAQEEVYDVAPEPGTWILDVDPAVVRAHAMGTLGVEAEVLGDGPGYLTTSDRPPNSVGYKTYEVLYFGPPDIKRTKVALRKNAWRVFEVKQRGANVDPTKLMKELKTEGDPVSLVAWRVGKSIRYALCRRAV